MDTADFIAKLKSPDDLKPADENALRTITQKYPYFQVAHALHLKVLKKEESFEFKKYLREAALHTTNRGILFDFINSNLEDQQHAVASITKHDDKEPEKNGTENISMAGAQVSEPDKSRNRANINSTEKHNFYEWLSLTKLKPLGDEKEKDASADTNDEHSNKNKLIDKFIKENPKIERAKGQTFTPHNFIKSKPSEQMMTETLAKIYLEQKKYSKAIQAYNILILNNPKKSGFFADQIKLIQSLQENN